MNLFRQLIENNETIGSQIPGSFNEDIAAGGARAGGANDSNRLQGEDPGNDNQRRSSFIGIFVRIPIAILYYFFKILIELVTFLKPLHILSGFYQKKHKRLLDRNTSMSYLLEKISNESEVNRHPVASNVENNVTYNFGSIYNLDNNSSLSSLIVQDGYTELLEMCTEQCKFAVIYLHDHLLSNSTQYINQIMCTEQFISTIKNYQCLTWFGDVTTSEGLQVANALKVKEFPFLGVLSLNGSSKVELIFRLEGYIENYDNNVLNAILAKENPKLIQLRQQKQNLELQRIIREQQDYRYQESLRRDQEAALARQQSLDNEARQQTREVQRKKWLLWRKNELRPEPTTNTNVCRVAIRLPNGDRIVRKFNSDLGIEEIYAFVELYQSDFLGSSHETTLSSPPVGYEHHYGFALWSAAPRKELQLTTRILEENSIYPSGNIVVENID
ncbi:hypothetical protein Kpol_1032p74 [Vanderwaltozyma polyspora DSM 70294]|uniref:UBX domain-containing protein n=1 Tax=Vanderwaltozyma polyspora (strain ATCC 22028 / DSM 70294 / BCRC 21397 / CBS 2163 / NBRC 10782 / NRRL Y-8283 / UCD 57-17) TaxID=436907 RepID=A7TH26_VANPO|nr:uncharacterized protein Kpol_1032p74 [Vanderwaltozyma polyspora DSM 70294]EDO18478.1 hypothetical protein Kpol_1032p74 [Vanderwaltozyma polyspora DSM 70294]